jgi:hypothetical protein
MSDDLNDMPSGIYRFDPAPGSTFPQGKVGDDLIKRLEAPTGINAFTKEPVRDRLRAEAAAALTEAQATIARLEAALETAKLWLDDYNTPPSVYDKIDAALSPDEPKIPTKAE